MSEYERYFIMSLDTDEEFVFDRVDIDANKIFGDIKISFEDAVELLNEQDAKIQQLEKELTLMKDKAYEYGCEWIYSVCGFTQDEEKDKLRQEIYGEKAEQKRLQELKKEIEKAVIYKNKSFYETIPPIPIHISRRPQDKIPIDERICKDCLYNSQGKCVVSGEYVDEEETCYGWEPK